MSNYIERVLASVKEKNSDQPEFIQAVEEVLKTSFLFAPTEAPEDLAGMTSDFERRWLEEGRTVRHLFFKRLPLPPKTIGH